MPMATYQRMAISSDDLQAAQQFEFPANTNQPQRGFSNYNRSRSESNLLDEDRCAAQWSVGGWKSLSSSKLILKFLPLCAADHIQNHLTKQCGYYNYDQNHSKNLITYYAQFIIVYHKINYNQL
jgi:hypothetical protein